MKKSLFLSVILFVLAFTINAQNDTLYLMKAGVVVGQYNVNTEIDSVIFYTPTEVPSEPVTVTDIDGNVYETVQIDNQLWMAANLNTTKYNDGTDIPNLSVAADWTAATTGAYAYHDETTDNGAAYGALYNYYAVETAKLCPTGWHVPTDDEWAQLVNYLGGINIAGGKLKETGTTHWFEDNGATNESGFTARGSGLRLNNADFQGITRDSYSWTSTNIIYWYMSHKDSVMKTGAGLKAYGFAVRCLKD